MASGSARPPKGARERARHSADLARSRPLLESPGLFLWVLIGDALLVHGYWLLAGATYFQAVLVHFGLMSVLAFLLFALDKWRARRGSRRVSELNLLVLSAVGGALGALLAMVAFSHKTRGLKFRVGVPAFVFLHLALALVIKFSDL